MPKLIGYAATADARPKSGSVGGVSDVAEAFESQRPRLFWLAYRLLGTEASEAEDAVQDAYLRLHAADAEAIESLPAWLTTAVTHLCLNRLTSARAPVGRFTPARGSRSRSSPTTVTPGPLDTAEQRESVSIALLSLMERLGPTERAAFVLREAFAYSHFEIAEILQTSEANARQLYRRARRRLGEPRPRFQPDRAQWRRLVDRFFTAARAGDVAGLVEILTDDVTSTADGGGKGGRRPASNLGPRPGGALCRARVQQKRGAGRPAPRCRRDQRRAGGAGLRRRHVSPVSCASRSREIR